MVRTEQHLEGFDAGIWRCLWIMKRGGGLKEIQELYDLEDQYYDRTEWEKEKVIEEEHRYP